MNTLLRFGLELPLEDLWADSPQSPLDQTVEVSGAVERAGFQTLWLTSSTSADAMTAQGAVAAATRSLGLGVVATLGAERAPTMVARDLTTLDVASGGRTALLYRMGPEESDGSASLRPVIEAVTISGQMLKDGTATMDGEFYRADGARNRPRPVTASGPPVVVQLDASGASSDDLGSLAHLVDAVCCGGDASAVADLSRRVAGACPVIWRGEMSPPVSALVHELIEAGAAGFICQRRGGIDLSQIEALGHELSPLMVRVTP